MKSKWLIAFILVLVLQVDASAQVDSLRSDSLALAEAVRIALQENHAITVARNNAQIDENKATLGNAGYYPQLTATGNYNRTIEDTRQSFIGDTADQVQNNSTSEQYAASLNANYTLFDGFGNYYRLQSLESQEELGSVQSRLQIETTLLQVVQRYLQVVAQSQLVDINRESVEISEQRFNRAEKQYEFGGINRVGLLNAEVALNQDSVRFVQSQADLRQAKNDLAVLLGSEPGVNLDVRPEISLTQRMNLQPLLQAALENNASLVSSQLRVEQARLALKQSQSQRYPQLDAQASYSYNRSESDASFLRFQEADGFSYGLTLSFNIFNGFQRNVDIQNAEIRLDNSQQLRRQAQKELRRDVRNVYETYSTNLFLLEKQQLNVETAELNFERTQRAFELGQITNTEFREAQLNLLQARQELVNLKVNAKLSEVELLQLTGKLSAQSFN